VPADDSLVIREICLLRLHTLLARARADETAYRAYRDRYCDMAKTLEFDGHIACAEATPSPRSIGRHAHHISKWTSFESLKTSCQR